MKCVPHVCMETRSKKKYFEILFESYDKNDQVIGKPTNENTSSSKFVWLPYFFELFF